MCDSQARIPTKAHHDDAGFDLYASRSAVIPPRSQAKVHTGIAATPPLGCYLRVADKSSIATIGLHVRGGIIDPSYTGEIIVLLFNHTDRQQIISKHFKVAQIIPEKISFPAIKLLDSPEQLRQTNPASHGTQEFGSSGYGYIPSQEGSEDYPSASPESDTPELTPDSFSSELMLSELEAIKYNMTPDLTEASSSSASSDEPETPDTSSDISLRAVTMSNSAKDLTKEQRHHLLQQQHLMGHFGAESIVKALKHQNIQWPLMLEDAKRICRSCLQCLRYNTAKHGYHPLTPITASQPFDHIAIDLAGPFPTSTTEQHWLLVIIDIHSRFVLLRTLPEKSGAEVAQELLKVFFDFGFPRIIQSDNGTEFVNQVVKHITEAAVIDHRLITPYHPRANGAAERTVQTAKRLILKLIKGIKQDWSLHVPFAQFCINNKIAERTKTAPFVAMFGRQSNILTDHSSVSSALPSDDESERRAKFMTQVLFPAIHEATNKVVTAVKERFDKKHKLVDFLSGMRVMATDETRATKTDPGKVGPFTIIRRTKGGSYEVQDLDGQKVSRNYPPSALVPIEDNDILVEPSYEVDKITDHRRNSTNDIEYKVRWKGCTAKDDTWEPFGNFDSMKSINDYWKQFNSGRKRTQRKPRKSKSGRK